MRCFIPTAPRHAKKGHTAVRRGRCLPRSLDSLALLVALLPLLGCGWGCGDQGQGDAIPHADDPSLQLESASVRYAPDLDAVIFEMEAADDAATVTPKPAGQLDGAPVLGYVFLTSLASTDVGFDAVEGTVALALTSHPDFDDTPLWDENGNATFDDDGAVYHAHWVVLVEDADAPAGLAVRPAEPKSQLPPTAPMPMYLDSPGFTVATEGSAIRVVVPADRMGRNLDIKVGAVTAFMRVDDAGDAARLRVHHVLSTVDDAELTLRVSGREQAPDSSWPATTQTTPEVLEPSFDVRDVLARYEPAEDAFVLTMKLDGAAGTLEPKGVGVVDGAPVLGYVFPTDISPAAVGFREASGTLVLAVTSHPDFDDTPLWDETMDGDYENDGPRYHVHWAVLSEDAESDGGLSVKSQQDLDKLPKTAPMAMYLDSPGYHAFARGDDLVVVVPGFRLDGVESFSLSGLTARMRVDASGPGPVLRVEQVYDMLSPDLELSVTVDRD